MTDSSFLRDFAGTDGTPPTTQHLYKAFVLLGSDFGYEEAVDGVRDYLADFTQRWGKPSPDNLLTVARRYAPGQPRSASEVEANGAAMDDVALGGPDTIEEVDTTFALATLGVMRIPEAPAALVPYLMSPYAHERWLAGFGLAAMHDERALPALERMLVEFIGPNQPASRYSPAGYYIQTLRSYLPQVLADWGDPRLVPLVRTALIATVRAEKIEVLEPHGPDEAYEFGGQRYVGKDAWEWFHFERRKWVEEEHRLVYALGRLSAFGALAGVPTRPGVYYYWGAPPTVYMDDESGENPVEVDSSEFRVPESHTPVFCRNIWHVHACCGFLEPQFRDRLKWVHSFDDAPEFVTAIEQLLEERFGLDRAERRMAMWDYDRARFLAGTINYYERLARLSVEESEEWAGD